MLGSWLKAQPLGLDTVIGEGGMGLSGGQAQRLALAFLYLKNPALILLDEPSAGLDLATKEILLAFLKDYAKDRTVIMLSHHTQEMVLADRILFLGPDGKLQTGTYQALLEHEAFVACCKADKERMDV